METEKGMDSRGLWEAEFREIGKCFIIIMTIDLLGVSLIYCCKTSYSKM